MKNSRTDNVAGNDNHDTKYDKIAYFPKKPRRFGRRNISYKVVIGFILFLLVGAGVLLSPIFRAEKIEVTKMQKFSSQEICQMIDLKSDSNIIAFGKHSAEKKLEKSPYIQRAKITITLPNTIHINVQERQVRGYIPYMGSYLYIDEFGRVLDIQKSFSKALPIVEGLQFNEFYLGHILDVDNDESFDVVVKIAQMMTKYQLLDLVVKIDVSDPKDVHAYVNHVDVLLGNITNCDQKIRTMGEILKTMKEEDRGTLDLRDMSKPIVFQYLT